MKNALIIAACIFLSFATDAFATSKNLYNITRNVTFVAIVALGMTIVIITGGIDLSVGSVLCLCSMVLATTMHSGQPIYVGIAASIGAALVYPLLLRWFSSEGPYRPVILLVGTAVAALVVARHLPNIRRLLQGKEPPLFGRGAKGAKP